MTIERQYEERCPLRCRFSFIFYARGTKIGGRRAMCNATLHKTQQAMFKAQCSMLEVQCTGLNGRWAKRVCE